MKLPLPAWKLPKVCLIAYSYLSVLSLGFPTNKIPHKSVSALTNLGSDAILGLMDSSKIYPVTLTSLLRKYGGLQVLGSHYLNSLRTQSRSELWQKGCAEGFSCLCTCYSGNTHFSLTTGIYDSRNTISYYGDENWFHGNFQTFNCIGFYTWLLTVGICLQSPLLQLFKQLYMVI